MNTTGTRTALLSNALLGTALLLGAGQAAAAEYWLCAKAGSVTMPGGVAVPIWGYVQDTPLFGNGCLGAPTLPGPALTVPAADATGLTVHLRNELPEPTSIVIPGQAAAMTPVWTDGTTGPRTSPTQRVRSFTHEAATGAGVATYTWASVKPGTYLYHSGTHPQAQVQMGLYGAAVRNAVDAVPATTPAQAYGGVPYDTQLTLLFSEIDPAQHAAIADGSFGTAAAPTTPCRDTGFAPLPMSSALCYRPKYFLINGKPFASGDAALATLQTGQRALLRLINAGLQSYVPVVQGMHMRMVAEDGNRYVYRDGSGNHPRDQYQYSTLLPALKTVDAVVTPTQAGRYPIYDRRLNLVNASAQDGGMFAYVEAVAGETVADLGVAKTDGVTSVAAGAPVSYTITVSNAGPDMVSGATVTDLMPAELTGVSWTCSATAGSSCAATSGSGNIGHNVNLASGGTATFSVNGTVSASASGATLTNTASVAAPAGATDPNSANNTATDSDTVTAAQADLAISKTDGVASVMAGGSTTYTIVVTNNGPSAVTGAAVTDPKPEFTAFTWSCTATPGSACAVGSSGGGIATTVNLASGGSATFVVKVTVGAGATGSMVNTATVTAPAGVTDPNPANNSATDTDEIAPPLPALTLRDNFNRVNANNLGVNWSQANAGTLVDLRVSASQAFANQVNDGGQAIWNAAAFGATQGAAYTYASALASRDNSALILKATGGTDAAPQNFVRVLVQNANGGQVVVQTTTDGGGTFATHGIHANANSNFVSGNRLTAQVNSTGTVRVWKSVGASTVYVGSVALPADALWTTGGGRIGMKFQSLGARVDNFSGN